MKPLFVVFGLLCIYFGIRHLALKARQWADETLDEPEENPDDLYTYERMNLKDEYDDLLF